MPSLQRQTACFLRRQPSQSHNLTSNTHHPAGNTVRRVAQGGCRKTPLGRGGVLCINHDIVLGCFPMLGLGISPIKSLGTRYLGVGADGKGGLMYLTTAHLPRQRTETAPACRFGNGPLAKCVRYSWCCCQKAFCPVPRPFYNTAPKKPRLESFLPTQILFFFLLRNVSVSYCFEGKQKRNQQNCNHQSSRVQGAWAPSHTLLLGSLLRPPKPAKSLPQESRKRVQAATIFTIDYLKNGL